MTDVNTTSTPPPPPRLTGDPATDNVAIVQWAWDFYRAVVIQNYYLQESGQFDPGEFDPSTLPDPASATIATAQNTANQAYALAANAKSLAEGAQADADTAQAAADAAQSDATSALAATGRFVVSGEVTIDNANNQATITFATPEPSANYNVTVQASGYAGSPAPSTDSFLVISKTKTVNDFSFTINAAPGAGKSVTFEYDVFRRS